MAEYIEDLGDENLNKFFVMPDEALLDVEFHDLLEETTKEVRYVFNHWVLLSNDASTTNEIAVMDTSVQNTK